MCGGGGNSGGDGGDSGASSGGWGGNANAPGQSNADAAKAGVQGSQGAYSAGAVAAMGGGASTSSGEGENAAFDRAEAAMPGGYQSVNDYSDSDAYSNALRGFGVNADRYGMTADEYANYARIGITPEQAEQMGLEAQARHVAANISPTMRQKIQGAIFGQNFSPSIQGLAAAIARGDEAGTPNNAALARAYNNGLLGSNDEGAVTPDALGQISEFAKTPLSILGLGPLGLVKMGIVSALTGRVAGPTPGVPGLGSLYSGYKSYSNLADANRALAGVRGGYGEATAGLADAAARASSPNGSGGGDYDQPSQPTLASVMTRGNSPLNSVQNNATQYGYAPNAGYGGGVVNFNRMFG